MHPEHLGRPYMHWLYQASPKEKRNHITNAHSELASIIMHEIHKWIYLLKVHYSCTSYSCWPRG